MAGHPLVEAQTAARAFLDRCDFTTTEVGLISFSDQVTLQAEATDNVRRVQAAIDRLEADGTHEPDRRPGAGPWTGWSNVDRTRYIVILTDGYPDAPESAVEQARWPRGSWGSRSWRSAWAPPTVDYLRRLASTEAGSIFARQGELVADVRPHRPGDRRGGPRLADAVMSRRPIPQRRHDPLRSTANAPAGLRPGPRRGDRGASSGSTSTSSWSRPQSVYVRDALAGVAIGGTIGFFLNAAGPFRDGAWLKLARAATWGALAGAAGGAVGLVLGEMRDRLVPGRPGRPGGLVGGARPGDRREPGAGRPVAAAAGLRRDRRRRSAGSSAATCFEALRLGLGNRYDLSQGLGIVILGAGLGLFLALVEQVLRRAWVQVLSGPQEGRSYLLARTHDRRSGSTSAPRSASSATRSIARRHAEIEATPRGYVLHNVGPAGRTRVNGAVVAGEQAAQGRRPDRAGADLAGLPADDSHGVGGRSWQTRARTAGGWKWCAAARSGGSIPLVAGPERRSGNASTASRASTWRRGRSLPAEDGREAGPGRALRADRSRSATSTAPAARSSTASACFPDQPRRLEPGDVIQLGAVQLKVVVRDRSAKPAADRHRRLAALVRRRSRPGRCRLPSPSHSGATCRTWDDFLTVSAQNWAGCATS